MTTKPDSLHMKLASHHLWLAFYPWGRHHWKNKFLKSISPSSLSLSQFDSVTCTLSIVFNVQKNRQAHLRGGGRGLQKAILYSFQEGFPKESALFLSCFPISDFLRSNSLYDPLMGAKIALERNIRID